MNNPDKKNCIQRAAGTLFNNSGISIVIKKLNSEEISDKERIIVDKKRQ